MKQVLNNSLLGCLGLLLLAGCSASDFETFLDPTYGISVKYPAEWEKRENTQGTLVAFLSPKESQFDPFIENFNIVAQDLFGSTNLTQFSMVAMDQLKKTIPKDRKSVV